MTEKQESKKKPPITSPRDATKASEVLRDPKASKDDKSEAGKTLSQAKLKTSKNKN